MKNASKCFFVIGNVFTLQSTWFVIIRRMSENILSQSWKIRLILIFRGSQGGVIGNSHWCTYYPMSPLSNRSPAVNVFEGHRLRIDHRFRKGHYFRRSHLFIWGHCFRIRHRFSAGHRFVRVQRFRKGPVFGRFIGRHRFRKGYYYCRGHRFRKGDHFRRGHRFVRGQHFRKGHRIV